MSHWTFAICLVLAVVARALSQATIDPKIFRRFEYKHSFKGPHLVDRKNRVPFWNSFGNALASADQVRLTPSIRSMKGHLWNNITYDANDWEVEVTLRVSGRGSVGGDGMAVWFRDQPGEDGPVFGVSDQWNGMGIVLDSFDNDGGMDNPMIYLIVNDGSKLYDHNSDGRTNLIGQCKRDFRNRPHPVHLRIRYFDGELKVDYSHGTSPEPSYELCLVSRNIKLPTSGVFGMSAATGGLADDHDVLKFMTTSLSLTPYGQGDAIAMKKEEAAKAQELYDVYSENLQKQKDEYAKEHPHAAAPDMLFETPLDRSINQVLSGVDEVRELVKNLHTVVVTKSMQTTVDGQQRQQQGGQAGAGASEAMISQSLSRMSQEVQQILRRNQDETNSMLRLHGDAIRRVPPSVQDAFPGVGRPDGPDMSQLSSDMAAVRRDIQQQQQLVQQLVQQISGLAASGQAAPSGEQQQCLSYTTVFILLAVESILAVIFLWRQKQKAAAAEKKFF